MTPDDAKNRYFYPSGNPRMACPPDNDGFPTCMGDTGFCGYSRELDLQVCVHTIPVGPDSCQACRELANEEDR